MDKVAVVILNWNGSDMLRKFLPSVLHYSLADDVSVYVADNGSTDDSVVMLQKEFPDVRLILLPKNFGFAEGYNQALSQVEAVYVVLLNSDVEVTEHWLDPLVQYLDLHPEVAACQPKIRSWIHKSYFEYAGAAGGFMDRYGYPFCRGRMLNVVEEDRGQYDTVCPVFWVTGAALFIRLADYRTVGGLDGSFFAHMEEIDLCWRLRARGKALVCIPQSVVYHVGAATLKRENPRKTFLNFRNNLLMLYKNLPEEDLVKVLCVRMLMDYVAVLHFLLHGQAANAWAVLCARRAFGKMRSSLKSVRVENLQHTMLSQIPERMQCSLLVQFYLKGKKKFSHLDSR
ncbi:glycosyltransferase, group 2 family protein [gut metagenome]|uniref:Glycosyltransferase, group 2 family protein n=1 Tax=gut metagenome TaxID=749906 RepID=J9FD51_9ZZZZ